MASRTTESPDDEFDLTRFLWGDLPFLGGQPETGDSEQPTAPPSSVDTFARSDEDRLVSEAASIQETSPNWRALAGSDRRPTTNADEATADDDEFDPEPDIGLDVLAELAALAEAELAADDSDDQLDDPDAFVLDERPLSYGELTNRLHKEVLPRLRSLTESQGYLTLGYLARAVVDLQDSNTHLDEVRAFVERINVPLLPSRSHRGVRQLPIWAIRKAQRRFGDLLHDQIDEHVVIDRFGYTGVPLSQGTRAFLVQAWMWHCLSREEERAHAATVAAEIARDTEYLDDWPAEALAAREALILDNLWLVCRLAQRHMGRGVEIDDLVQFGALGLFRAVEKFNPDLGYRFVTYASNWVFQSITRNIGDHARLIRLPVHTQVHGKAIQEAKDELEQLLEREPTLAEIAEASSTSEEIVRAHLVTTRTIRLDDPVARRALAAMVEPENAVEITEAAAVTDAITSGLDTLTERERDVLERRFGLHDDSPRTLEEISVVYGVTRERIRQIEDKALRRLRHPSRIKLLRTAVDPPRSNPVLHIPAEAAKFLLYEFSSADQAIIRSLWGLDGQRQRSMQSAAKQHRVSTGHVQNVSLQVATLHRTRSVAPTPRSASTSATQSRGETCALLPWTTTRNMAHPGWMLATSDKTDADWANRLFGIPRAVRPAALPHTQLGLTSDAPINAEEATAILDTRHLTDPEPSSAIAPAPSEDQGKSDSELESTTTTTAALSDEGWQVIARATRRITDRDLRAVAEARLGLNGWGDLSQEATMRQMGVTTTYVKRAEQELVDAIHEPKVRQALRDRWAAIEAQQDATDRNAEPKPIGAPPPPQASLVHRFRRGILRARQHVAD